MNEQVITTAGEAPAPAPVVDPETEISFSLVHIFLDLPRRISAILDGSGRSALQLVQVGKDVRETVEGWSYIFTGAQVDPVMAGVRSCYSLARFDVEKFDHRSGGIYRRADWQQQCMSCTTSLEPIRKYEFDEIYRETDGDPDPRQRCPECGAKMTGFPVVEPRLPDQHYRRTVDEVRRCMRTPNETYEWVLPRVYGMFLGRDAGRLRDNPSMNWAPGSTDECAMMQDLCSKYQAPHGASLLHGVVRGRQGLQARDVADALPAGMLWMGAVGVAGGEEVQPAADERNTPGMGHRPGLAPDIEGRKRIRVSFPLPIGAAYRKNPTPGNQY